MLQNLKLVIFDMDGLLLDTERVYYEAFLERCAAEDIELDIAVFLESFGTTGLDIRRMVKNRPGREEELRPFFRGIGESCREKMVREGPPVKPGARELLDFLDQHNIPKVIATSTARWKAEPLLRSAGLLDRFDAVVCGDEVEKTRPHPEIFLKACAAGGAIPGGAIVLEDSLNGVLAACAAGIRCVMVPDLIDPPDEIRQKVFAMIQSLADLPALLCGQVPPAKD